MSDDIHQWFSLKQLGHQPLGLADEARATLAEAKAEVAKHFPHMVEMPIADAPLYPGLVFEEAKQEWTSFYSRSEVVAIFAFSDVKDAVEFRLKV